MNMHNLSGCDSVLLNFMKANEGAGPSSGLSGGAIAGIVIGAAIFTAIVVAVAMALLIKRHRRYAAPLRASKLSVCVCARMCMSLR